MYSKARVAITPIHRTDNGSVSPICLDCLFWYRCRGGGNIDCELKGYEDRVRGHPL